MAAGRAAPASAGVSPLVSWFLLAQKIFGIKITIAAKTHATPKPRQLAHTAERYS